MSGYDRVRALAEAGMDVARINFSHGDYGHHAETIALIKQVRSDLGTPLAIMLDTKGPEVRLCRLPEGGIELNSQQLWRLDSTDSEGDEKRVGITPGSVLTALEPGAQVLFDDGYISGSVVAVDNQEVTVKIDNGGKLISGKGVNFPYTHLKLPILTEKDRADLAFGVEHDVDIVAASFVRSAEDMVAIKALLAEAGKPDILVLAKIENHEGIENFDSILQVSDGIMIARGDLGVEVPLAQVPKLQKMMIRKSYHAGKPAVTATQMLESMIYNPRPTRAEVSDVANAIYDSTSAVMLSGETAVGRYPVETVAMMRSIVAEAEHDFDYQNFFHHYMPLAYHDVPSAVTLSSVKTAYSAGARAIFALTTSGATARLLSRLRPQIPILAMTSKEKSYHQLAMNWGVTPILTRQYYTVEEAYSALSRHALERGLVNYGDLVIVTAGAPFGIQGTTNMMLVESIGQVLVRGDQGRGSSVHGNVLLVPSIEGVESYQAKDRIVVVNQYDNSYEPLLCASAGMVLQNHVDDRESEMALVEVGQRLSKPVIIRADNAFNILHDNQLVTLDPAKGTVYKGVVLSEADKEVGDESSS